MVTTKLAQPATALGKLLATATLPRGFRDPSPASSMGWHLTAQFTRATLSASLRSLAASFARERDADDRARHTDRLV